MKEGAKERNDEKDREKEEERERMRMREGTSIEKVGETLTNGDRGSQ